MEGSIHAIQAEHRIRDVLYRLDMVEVLEEDLYDNIDHAELVALLVRLLCTQMELPLDFQNQVVTAAYLHDIGKLRLSNNLYGRDKNALQIEETRYMRMHAGIGAGMLEECGYSPEICNAVLHHHENYDGSGYPYGLAREEIPLEDRIFAIADAYDVMVHNGLYKGTVTEEEALEEIKNCSGKQFDPVLVNLFEVYMKEK